MIAKPEASAELSIQNFESPPQERLTQAAIPSTVTIILIQGFSDEVSCLVQPGDGVKAGQIIGRDDDSISSPVHASVNGKVVNVGKLAYLGNEVAAVTIESDGTDGWQARRSHGTMGKPFGRTDREARLSFRGGAQAGRASPPDSKLDYSCGDVEYVIIHGVESE